MSLTQLLIDGKLRPGTIGAEIPIENPADGSIIGQVACAGYDDLRLAVETASAGFATWRRINGHERCKVLRRAAAGLRQEADRLARLLTLEQGKPLADAKGEVTLCAETLDWFADEARRTYGRVVPARVDGMFPMVLREPVGVVAAFTPWNLPLTQVVRKVAAALAAGCAVIVKGPEEAPSAVVEAALILIASGVPPAALSVLFGKPHEISEFLIPHPSVAKISFTGSVPVGKRLAALAGLHMKRATMELGGHAPVIVCADADIPAAASALATSKIRNAGQTCISPTRFLVEASVYEDFTGLFVAQLAKTRVGNGMLEGMQMGPLINAKRLEEVDRLIQDATAKGARLLTGGSRLGNAGHFYPPTVVADVTPDMTIMNEEPFGPVAALASFEHLDQAISEANRLRVGLGAYAFARSSNTIAKLSTSVHVGMLRFNQLGAGGPELPFGGVGDSGYGWECGLEGMDAYLASKLVVHAAP